MKTKAETNKDFMNLARSDFLKIYSLESVNKLFSETGRFFKGSSVKRNLFYDIARRILVDNRENKPIYIDSKYMTSEYKSTFECYQLYVWNKILSLKYRRNIFVKPTIGELNSSLNRLGIHKGDLLHAYQLNNLKAFEREKLFLSNLFIKRGVLITNY